MTTQVPHYPAMGEVFELTLDGDAPENQPLEMAHRDGYRTEGWQHTGKKVAGKQTRRFKLVSVGYCRTFDELTRKLVKHGTIPDGQWREALKAAYQYDGKEQVGIADSSWVHPQGRDFFPYVSTGGYSNFHFTDLDFDVGWRWLVEVESNK